MKKVAISACLLGEACRYDGTDNKNEALLARLKEMEIVPFCPEDHAFGTPRPTMDLIKHGEEVRAISNETGEDLSSPVVAYAKAFFDAHPDIDLFIGKDRSPSCGVCSAKCYDEKKTLLSAEATGLMAAEAKTRGIKAVDAEIYLTGV
jgi:uncharacterized protein YbbK (DUF523 family)